MTLGNIAKKIKDSLIQVNGHRTTQIFFIAYPKTGSTWVRMMLGKYVQLACNLSALPLFDAYDWLGRCERYCIGRSMHFSHTPLTWENQTARDLEFANVISPFLKKKVVLIIRNPLDTLVSMWFQEKYRTEIGFTGDLTEFLEHPIFGLEKFFCFHRLWAESCDKVKGFHLVRYEDLKISCADHFRELLQFLGMPVTERFLQAAVDYGSFDNLKNLEKSGAGPHYPSSGLDIFATGDRNHPDAYHIRRGKVGGYKDYLDPDMVTQYEARVAQEMTTWNNYLDRVSEG